MAIGSQDTLSRPPSGEEWKLLYDMAKKQSLVGICFAAVQRLNSLNPSNISNLSELQYLTWMGMAAKIQQRNEVVNRQCAELQARLFADGFRSYIMKGQANAALYRVVSSGSKEFQVSEGSSLSGLRQSGDIDVYLEGGLDKVLAYARTFGEVAKVNELEMHVDVFPDTEVEFHYMPFFMRSPIRNKRLQAFFESKKEECFANKIALPNGVGEIVTPTVEFNLVHQLVHIYHHFITEGVGLRQLMDYYFVLRTSYDPCASHPSDSRLAKVSSTEFRNQNENVLRVVRDLGLDRFASAFMWVIKTVFVGHDDDNDNFFPWKPCEKDGRVLLNEILKSGNFGHHDETKADLSNKWKSFWYVNGKTFRFWRFDHWAWFWSPLWRACHFAWRKIKGFE